MRIKDLTGKLRSLPGEAVADARVRKLKAAMEEAQATIAGLEQSLAERDEQLAEAKQLLAQTSFKCETLERSYATQLEKARQRAETGEQLAEERKAALDELQSNHKKLTRELEYAQSRLDAFGPSPVSINDLLAGVATEREDRRRSEREDTLQPRSDEEMLAPDVMLAPGKKR